MVFFSVAHFVAFRAPAAGAAPEPDNAIVSDAAPPLTEHWVSPSPSLTEVVEYFLGLKGCTIRILS